MSEIPTGGLVKRAPGRPRREPKRAANGTRRYVPITVQLDPVLLAALDTQAAEEGAEGRSDVIRRACREYLRRAAKRPATGAEEPLEALLRTAAEEDPTGAIARFLNSLQEHTGKRGKTP